MNPTKPALHLITEAVDGAQDPIDSDVEVHESRADRESAPFSQWLAALRQIEMAEVRIDAWLGRDVRFERPACVVARGLFGSALRRESCLTGAPSCDGCNLHRHCLYGSLFTPAVARAHIGPALPLGYGDLHSYWLQGVPAEEALEAGTEMTVQLRMVDPASDWLPVLQVALRGAIASLGARPGQRESPAVALSPTAAERRRLLPRTRTSATWVLHTRTPLLLTPPRSREDGEAECPAAPWFSRLLVQGMRRLEALARLARPMVVLPRSVLPDLREVALVGGEMAPWRGSTYSRRQDVRYPLEHGLAGTAVLQGDALRDLGPLLVAIATVNAGKKTTMGFGELEAIPVRRAPGRARG